MKINAIVIALAIGIGWIAVQACPVAASNSEASLLQRNSDLSAAARQARKRHQPPPAVRPWYRGFADPSFGPDGRPYQVPEYLRGQCYIDEGYGRFSACFYR